MDEESATTIKKAAEVEERSGNVDVGNVNVPVFVGPDGLLESRAFLGWLYGMKAHQSCVSEDSIDAGRTGGDDIGVEHHEGQTPIAFQGILGVEVQDRLFLPAFEPPLTRDIRIMVVIATVAFSPRVEFARRDAQPTDEAMDGEFGSFGPMCDVVDDGVTDVLGNPGFGQSSPRSFFRWRCSSISSETTSFLR